jgi:hypothetical protein
MKAQVVIENPSQPLAKNAGRVLQLQEVWRITDESGGFFFKYPQILMTAPDGSRFVLDSDQLLQFDARGRFLRNYFKKGQGPGELNQVSGFDFANGRLIVHSNSPGKIVWYDLQGTVLKEVSLAMLSPRLKFCFYQDGTYWLFKDSYPPPTGKTEAFDIRQILVAVSEDGRKAEDPASFVNAGFRRGGAMIYQSLIMVPFEQRYIFVTNSRKYAINIFDSRSKKVLGTFARAYERVKRPSDSRASAIISQDGTRYEAPGSEYLEDVGGLYVYKDFLWATTSKRDKDKGTLIDVYNLGGKYVDAFWLKLKGSLLAVSGNVIYIREKSEDETLRIVGYKVIGD